MSKSLDIINAVEAGNLVEAVDAIHESMDERKVALVAACNEELERSLNDGTFTEEYKIKYNSKGQRTRKK